MLVYSLQVTACNCQYLPILITVECPEDMITELGHTAAREALAVYFHEGLFGQVPIWTVCLEPLVPLLDRVLGVVGVVGQEVDVFF